MAKILSYRVDEEGWGEGQGLGSPVGLRGGERKRLNVFSLWYGKPGDNKRDAERR